MSEELNSIMEWVRKQKQDRVLDATIDRFFRGSVYATIEECGNWRDPKVGPFIKIISPKYTSKISDAKTLLMQFKGYPQFHVYYEQRHAPEGLHSYKFVKSGSMEPDFCYVVESTPYEDPEGALSFVLGFFLSYIELIQVGGLVVSVPARLRQ